MTSFSIWNFNKFNSLEELIKTIEDNKSVVQKSRRTYGERELKNEIGIFEGVEEVAIDTMECMNEMVEFVAFGTNCQVCRKNQETEEYEVRDVLNNIVAFEKSGTVKVVILASHRNAEMIIKRMFSNRLVWGEIIEDEYVSEDMLYWLFYRLREMQDDLIVSEPKMFLKGIISYLGRTNDKINAVRGIGIRVSALLGTLGMLLGEESLRALRPMIQFGEHELTIELYIGNSGKIYPKTYIGPYRGDKQNIDDNDPRFKIELVLLVCKYILPSIKKGYKDSCDRQEWSIYIKRVFLNAIGNEMSEKIKNVMQNIELEIKMYEGDSEESMEDTDDTEIEELLDEEDLEEEIE